MARKPVIVVAPNAFKETFSPREAARLIARGLRQAIDATLILIPIADGGDGTLEALRASIGGRKVHVTVTGPMKTRIRAYYLRAGKTAVIEMAKASGLKLVPPEQRNPLIATSQGTGELIAHAYKAGARRILLGVGGSATVDGGRGCASLVPPKIARCVTVLCDVENPFLGPKGAARVFGPQKGAPPKMVDLLEQINTIWARDLKQMTGIDVRRIKGTGAAGGLPALLVARGAKLVRGAEYILKEAGFPRPCDYVVTGEGCIDQTSLGGKAVGTVLRLSPAPVALVCGRCELKRKAFETGDRAPEALVRAAQRAGEWIKARLDSGR